MKLRLALIGTGGIARCHVRPEGQLDKELFPNDEAQFTAVMDIDGERAKDFAQQYGIPHSYTNVEEMLEKEKPHIVNIATPPAFHAPLSIQAMEAGAWVMCEKPLCTSLREYEAIKEAERRTGNFTSSVFQFRFGSASQHLKTMIEEQVAGRILVGTCHTTWFRDHDYYEREWRGTWSSELGGPTMGHGIHAMDTFLWTMGDWKEVRALTATVDRNIEVEDSSSASVLFENGAVGNILNTILSPHELTFLRYDFQQASAWTEGALYTLGNDKWRFHTRETMAEDKAERFRTITNEVATSQATQLREMVHDYHAQRRPLVSGPEARRTIEFISALYKSAATGQAVARGSIQPGDPYYEHVGGERALEAMSNAA